MFNNNKEEDNNRVWKCGQITCWSRASVFCVWMEQNPQARHSVSPANEQPTTPPYVDGLFDGID